MQVRTARAADIPELHRLIHRAYRGDSARRGWTHEADLLGGQRTDAAGLESILADARQAMLVGEVDDALAACVAVRLVEPGLGYIGMVTVDPERQGGGLGRRLLEAAETYCAQAFGAARVEMTVIAQRAELIAWYERRGYRLTGERRPFPLDDPRFGEPKRRDLEFVVLEKRL